MKSIITMIGGAILLLLSTTAHAADPWTPGQQSAEAVLLMLSATDWQQTLAISRSNVYYEQANPFLGRHPDPNQVNAVFAVGMILHPIIANALSSDNRRLWIGVGIFIEAIMVGNNAAIGVQVKF